MKVPNAGCRECRHFRTYRPLSQMMVRELRAEQSLTILTELNRFIAAESERRDGETQTRVEVVDQGKMEWPLRPSMSDYCGEREDEGLFYLHEVRNVERTCPAFASRDRELVYCDDCLHVRPGEGWEDDQQTRSELSRTLSGARDEQSLMQASQLMERHRDLVDQRKLTEANNCLYGLRFADGPPRYLSHCAVYSREGDFVPCLLRNAHNRCARFTAAAMPEPSSSTAPAAPAKEAKAPAQDGRVPKGFFK